MKKTKMITGLCLMAQSALFFVLFLVYWNKSRSLSRTLAVFSAVGGLGGAWLVISELKEKKRFDAMNEDFSEFDEDYGEEFEDPFDGEISCAFGAEADE